MSQPKKRKHPHHTDTPKQAGSKLYYRIVPVAVFIFLLFGIGIAFFAAGDDTASLVTGAIIGAFCGFLFGYQVAKGLSKK